MRVRQILIVFAVALVGLGSWVAFREETPPEPRTFVLNQPDAASNSIAAGEDTLRRSPTKSRGERGEVVTSADPGEGVGVAATKSAAEAAKERRRRAEEALSSLPTRVREESARKLVADPEKLAQLGEYLFTNPTLSRNGKISCATCHDPKRQFADGMKQSNGVFEIPVGANTPSLVALGHVAAFPGRDAEGNTEALTLEERCVAPIVNPLEMGADIGPVLVRLEEDEVARWKFGASFPEDGPVITEETVGRALAAYVRTLEMEKAPFGRYLEGETSALTYQQQDGLKVFRGVGRCNTCHSGEALSDGLMHIVRSISSRRRRAVAKATRQELEELIEKADKKRAVELKRVLRSRGAIYYGGLALATQTLPLWDVARTGPYFRDGSIKDLRETVEVHIDEMIEVDQRTLRAAERASRRRGLRAAFAVPELLTPDGKKHEKVIRPKKLEKDDLDAVVAFLRSLSPE